VSAKGPRHRHPAPDPHAGDPVASGEMAAGTRRADSSPHAKRAVFGRGLSNRRSRGWPRAGLCAPAHCPRTLLHPRPRSAPRRRDPRCSLRCASGRRLPVPIRPRGARELRRDLPPAAPADLHPRPKTFLGALEQNRCVREGGGKIRPAGDRSHCAGACGHRAGVSRWGIAGEASGEQRGAPPRDVPARSHAQVGRRAGLEAQPRRPLPARRATRKPHAVKEGKGSSRLGPRAKRRSRSETKGTGVRGGAPGRAMTRRATRCSAAGREKRGSRAAPRGPRARGRGGSARTPPGAGRPTGAQALPEGSQCW